MRFLHNSWFLGFIFLIAIVIILFLAYVFIPKNSSKSEIRAENEIENYKENVDYHIPSSPINSDPGYFPFENSFTLIDHSSDSGRKTPKRTPHSSGSGRNTPRKTPRPHYSPSKEQIPDQIPVSNPYSSDILFGNQNENENENEKISENKKSVGRIRIRLKRPMDSSNLNFIQPMPVIEEKQIKTKKSKNESKGERLCRQILEDIYGCEFPSVRPDFLKNPITGYNLELDGYNENLQLAFEYQGIQHYRYPNRYHKSEEEFWQQIKRDKYKHEACEQAGIYLIAIPYHVPENRIRDYILERIPENIENRDF